MALQLLLAAPIYTGFVTSWDAFDLPAYSYVWNTPENTSSADGLGQAITYAVASTFCEDLLPHFSERSNILPFLVNCQLLRAALARAFATWADNHPYIKFLDISDRCDVAEVWECRGKVDTNNCGCGVEILLDVASNDPKIADRSASSNERAAFVRQRTQLGLVRTPAGEVHQALASVEADLFFNHDLCWYPLALSCPSPPSFLAPLSSVSGARQGLHLLLMVSLVCQIERRCRVGAHCGDHVTDRHSNLEPSDLYRSADPAASCSINQVHLLRLGGRPVRGGCLYGAPLGYAADRRAWHAY